MFSNIKLQRLRNITLTNIERFYNTFQHFAKLQFNMSEMLIQYYCLLRIPDSISSLSKSLNYAQSLFL